MMEVQSCALIEVRPTSSRIGCTTTWVCAVRTRTQRRQPKVVACEAEGGHSASVKQNCEGDGEGDDDGERERMKTT